MFRYELDEDAAVKIERTGKDGEDTKLSENRQLEIFNTQAEQLREQLIGDDEVTKSPFNVERRILYCDFTASGRAVKSIENFVNDRILPFYGNTHTLTTATARQSTFFRNEARQICKNYFNCCPVRDALIFCGSGVTGAIAKFVKVLEESCIEIEDIRKKTDSDSKIRRKSGQDKFVPENEAIADFDFAEHMTRYFKTDRWGSCECSLCDVRLKTEACFRAHLQSVLHLEKHAKASEVPESDGEEVERRAKNEKTTAAAENLANSKSSNESHETNTVISGNTANEYNIIDNNSEGSKTPSPREESPANLIFYVDPLAHHSTSLPFRELSKKYGKEKVIVREFTNISSFEEELMSITDKDRRDFTDACDKQKERNNKLPKKSVIPPPFKQKRIAILAAASNVTGYKRDVAKFTQFLHKRNCLVAFDFAAWAGHGKIDLNPRNVADANVDAAFFSPHKLIGGVGTSGLLAMKKSLLRNVVPTIPGGGNVFFVSDNNHSYISNPEEREEAGTPNIIADIRCGLAYRLHNAMRIDFVEKREKQMYDKVLNAMTKVDNFEILGNVTKQNLDNSIVSLDSNFNTDTHFPILSFMIRDNFKVSSKRDLYLHYNYVSCILNDVFGIQSRGGCACAGPYAQKLLGMDEELSNKFDRAMMKFGTEVIRPGFVRVGLHFTMSEYEVDLLIAALKWVSEHGHKLLPWYNFDVESGEWNHIDAALQKNRIWISDLDLFSGELISNNFKGKKAETSASDLYDKARENAAKIAAEKGHAQNPSAIADLEKQFNLKNEGAELRKNAKKNAEPISELLAFANAIAESKPSKQFIFPTFDSRVAEFIWFTLPQDSSTNVKNSAEQDNLLVFGEADVERPNSTCFNIPGYGANRSNSGVLLNQLINGGTGSPASGSAKPREESPDTATKGSPSSDSKYETDFDTMAAIAEDMNFDLHVMEWFNGGS